MLSINEIDKILPQAQCGDCSYKSCYLYAKAIVDDKASLNLCAFDPLVFKKLQDYFKHKLNLQTINSKHQTLSYAVINENDCIGCTKCIKVCPVDAIIGARKHMHSILEYECTGCGLCIVPCPVDCIALQQDPNHFYNKDVARNRYNHKQNRLIEEKKRKNILINQQEKQAYILQAIARVKNKKENKHE